MDDLDLLNRWQHGFPFVERPFAHVAAQSGRSEAEVLAAYGDAQRAGVLSRIGGVWAAGAGGAALLCAWAVPPERLADVAAVVDAVPGVNHNYEREHRFNLWFVITGRDAATLQRRLDLLEAGAGLPALRLPMQRVYRIDLGFDLEGAAASTAPAPQAPTAPPVDPADAPLAAWVEDGLPLVSRPFGVWAQALGMPQAQVCQTLQRWLDQGTLRRFGVVVRHHELGFDQNAMTVFDVPDGLVDTCGAALARQPGVTLCYRRARAEGWPYNLYCMVHGRERDAVRQLIALATHAAGLQACAHEVLFSRRRFKQQGASYFRDCAREQAHVA
jgi:DNA-binding Lrp family transcriptional regulator